MCKENIIKRINTNIDDSEKVEGLFYRGKSFAVVKWGDRIQKIFKTKRGAEGYILKNKNFSYYDDYSQDLVYPNSNLEVVEILESEYVPIKENKMLWYAWLKDCLRASYMWDSIEHRAKKELAENEELLKYVMDSLDDLRNNRGLIVYEEIQEVAVQEVAATKEMEEVEETQEVGAAEQNDIEIQVKFNEEKKGIEIYFTNKPENNMLMSLKANGFRWSRFNKCWYAKDSEEKREYLKSLGLLGSGEKIQASEIKEIEYPEIDINDIDTYIIAQNIIDMENNNSMFRRENVDHNKTIKNTLQSFNNEVLEALEGNTNKQTEYYALNWLQGYKKKYFNLYVKMLTHKAYNPSWMVTGRGGVNISRYNKKQEQYSKMVVLMGELTDTYNEKIRKIKNNIKKESKGLQKKELEEILNNVDMKNVSFEKKLIKYNLSAVDYIFSDAGAEKKVNYLSGYYAFKNWGCWRVYNEKGKEVFQTNTTGKLEDAKRWIIAKVASNIQA